MSNLNDELLENLKNMQMKIQYLNDLNAKKEFENYKYSDQEDSIYEINLGSSNHRNIKNSANNYNQRSGSNYENRHIDYYETNGINRNIITGNFKIPNDNHSSGVPNLRNHDHLKSQEEKNIRLGHNNNYYNPKTKVVSFESKELEANLKLSNNPYIYNIIPNNPNESERDLININRNKSKNVRKYFNYNLILQ